MNDSIHVRGTQTIADFPSNERKAPTKVGRTHDFCRFRQVHFAEIFSHQRSKMRAQCVASGPWTPIGGFIFFTFWPPVSFL